MSTLPWEHVESKTVQTEKTKGAPVTQISKPDTLANTISLPSQQNQGKGGKKKSYKILTLTHNHSQAQAMVAPNQPQYFNPEIQIQVGHTYNVQPVAAMIIFRKIATRTISALDVGQNHMPHT